MKIHARVSDIELIALLKEDSENLKVLYAKHYEYCMSFMRKMHNDDNYNKDVYHDALIVLYEKITTTNFVLTCSIQTYLNSICRNQLLIRFKTNSNKFEFKDEYVDNIKDWFLEVDENDTKVKSILFALEELKNFGGKCYEIIQRFFYLNQSMDKIATELGYSNADNVKNQKARCQKRLKEIALNYKNNS